MLTTAPSTQQTANPDAKRPPRVDLARFRADLVEAGVEEVMGALLATFVEDAASRYANLEAAVRSGKAESIESAAHAFKSGASTIRATYLAEGLAATEAAAHASNLDSIDARLEQIRVEYLDVVAELSTLQPAAAGAP